MGWNVINQWWDNDKCQYKCKKHHICEKYYVQNPNTCICENGKYLASIMGDSNKYLEETSFYERNIISFTKFLYSACLFLNYHCIIDSC